MTAIEGCRGVAALLVLIAHASLYAGYNNNGVDPFYGFFRAGTIGVDFFFTLSGFVIAYSTIPRIGNLGEVIPYFKRRWLRIFPVYWGAFAIFLFTKILFAEFREGWRLGFGQIFWDLSLLPQKDYPLIPVAWSLQCEEFFYVLFVSFLLNRRLGTIIFSIWGILILLLNPQPDKFLQWFLFNGMNFQFLLGVCLGFYLRNQEEEESIVGFKHILCAIFGLSFLAVAFLARMTHPPEILSMFSNEFYKRLLSGFGALFLLYGISPIRVSRTAWGLFWEWLGKRSYSIYLVHIGLLEFVFLKYGKGLFLLFGLNGYFIATSLAAVLFGIVFYRFVELPAVRFAKNKLE